MQGKNVSWLKTVRDTEPESVSIFTGRLLELFVFGVLIPLAWVGVIAVVQLWAALKALFATGIAIPVYCIVIVFLLFMFRLGGKHYAESFRLCYALFASVIRLIAGIAVGVLEVTGGRTLAARFSGFVLFVTLVGVGLAFFFYIYLFSQVFSVASFHFTMSGDGLLSMAKNSYVIALVLCFFAFTVEVAISDRWWQLFSRVAIDRYVDPAAIASQKQVSATLGIAHISDLHAHGAGTGLIEDPNRVVSSDLLEKLFGDVSRADSIEAVVLSGDATDDGSVDAWSALMSIPSWEKIERKLVLAPGNHDLNFLESNKLDNFTRIEHRTEIGMQLRALRYLRVADKIMGDRASFISPLTGGLTTLRDVMQRVEPEFKLWTAAEKVPGPLIRPLEFLEQCFPMVVTTDNTKDKCVFLVWNSVKPNTLPVWNSVGEITSQQVSRARKLLVHIPSSTPIIHVMHHQVTLPQAATRKIMRQRAFGVGMILNYSQRIFDLIAELRQNTVLLHGHHHKAFWCTNIARSVDIVSAPSATLGCEESFFETIPSNTQLPHWLRLTVGLHNANAHVVKVEPVQVMQPVKATACGRPIMAFILACAVTAYCKKKT